MSIFTEQATVFTLIRPQNISFAELFGTLFGPFLDTLVSSIGRDQGADPSPTSCSKDSTHREEGLLTILQDFIATLQ